MMHFQIKDADIQILIDDLELILTGYGEGVWIETKHDVEEDAPVRHIRDFINVLKGKL